MERSATRRIRSRANEGDSMNRACDVWAGEMHVRTQAQGIVVMIQSISKKTKSMRKLAMCLSAAVLTVLFAAPAAMGQSANPPATRPAATTAPANRLVADGVGADGKIKMAVNKT